MKFILLKNQLNGFPAFVAQGIEHSFPKRGGAGSNPAEGIKKRSTMSRTHCASLHTKSRYLSNGELVIQE